MRTFNFPSGALVRNDHEPIGDSIDPLRRRLAIVTGAGSGLGRAFCLQLAADDDAHHIVALDIDESAGRQTLDEMQKTRGRSTGEYLRLDVTDWSAWQQLADRFVAELDAQKYFPQVLLINNAGICDAAETLTSDPARWRQVMDVNFYGVLNGCQTFGPLLRRWSGSKGPHSRIINVASIIGMLPGPSMGAYAASKAAVIALSESLYAELRPAGVHVTIVAPGFFETGLLDRGTFCTPRHREEAERLSQNARFTADDVARHALAASKRGDLYSVVGRRARWLWRFKRLAPRLLQRIMAKRYHETFDAKPQSNA